MAVRSTSVWVIVLVAMAASCVPSASTRAADLTEAEQALRGGDYAAAIEMAGTAITEQSWNEQWPRLMIEAQMATGDYAGALQTFQAAQRRFSSSLVLRMQGIDVLRMNGQGDEALAEQAAIFELLRRNPNRYAGSENLVTVGRYFADRGEDARKVLELFYDRVRDADPDFTATYVATAELALSKHDYAVAADALERAAKLDDDDPQIAYLAARAWEPSDSERAEKELHRALELNPRHIPSLLMQAEALIDRERYEAAEKTLSAVEAINPKHPRMWAFRAVLAHLRGDWPAEQAARKTALQPWPRNPEVDHLIGRQLSQKYRFAEGAAAQRRALEFDPEYLEARFQLAQDLLRLGQDEAGWELAEWTHQEDAYHVVAFNLMTLRDSLRTFTILRRGDLLVRMQAHETEVYGDAVLDLLSEAQQTLCAKYEIEPDGPIVVEIFPNQQDFAIRTFGLPGGDGFLGVCFGRVITANSPASQGPDPSNWHSVLWHEFCHVVTLSKSNNRMPRWLSEGISVYEERQRDPTWGQQMTPTYRKMILGDDLTPLSELSGAFLSPKSGLHLQLAYYESSLAVEYLIETYGLDVLKRVLVDLGVGMPAGETLQRYAGSLKELDEGFVRFATERAESYGEDFDWSDEDLPAGGDVEAWRDWLADRPDNYWGLRGMAAALIAEKQYANALVPLRRIVELFPEQTVDTAALAELARCYQALGDPAGERATLETLVEHHSDAFAALVRLMDLQAQEGDWPAVAASARRALQVNPLMPVIQQRLAEALEHTGATEQAVEPLQALATMDPVDPAGLSLRTARALLAAGDREAAKRATLVALEEAPHYRQAQQLLLELTAP